MAGTSLDAEISLRRLRKALLALRTDEAREQYLYECAKHAGFPNMTDYANRITIGGCTSKSEDMVPPDAIQHSERLYMNQDGWVWFVGWLRVTYWGRFLGASSEVARNDTPVGVFEVLDSVRERSSISSLFLPLYSASQELRDAWENFKQPCTHAWTGMRVSECELMSGPSRPVRRWAPNHPSHGEIMPVDSEEKGAASSSYECASSRNIGIGGVRQNSYQGSPRLKLDVEHAPILPPELLQIIQAALPMRDFFRSKLVCKEWYTNVRAPSKLFLEQRRELAPTENFILEIFDLKSSMRPTRTVASAFNLRHDSRGRDAAPPSCHPEWSSHPQRGSYCGALTSSNILFTTSRSLHQRNAKQLKVGATCKETPGSAREHRPGQGASLGGLPAKKGTLNTPRCELFAQGDTCSYVSEVYSIICDEKADQEQVIRIQDSVENIKGLEQGFKDEDFQVFYNQVEIEGSAMIDDMEIEEISASSVFSDSMFLDGGDCTRECDIHEIGSDSDSVSNDPMVVDDTSCQHPMDLEIEESRSQPGKGQHSRSPWFHMDFRTPHTHDAPCMMVAQEQGLMCFQAIEFEQVSEEPGLQHGYGGAIVSGYRCRVQLWVCDPVLDTKVEVTTYYIMIRHPIRADTDMSMQIFQVIALQVDAQSGCHFKITALARDGDRFSTTVFSSRIGMWEDVAMAEDLRYSRRVFYGRAAILGDYMYVLEEKWIASARLNLHATAQCAAYNCAALAPSRRLLRLSLTDPGRFGWTDCNLWPRVGARRALGGHPQEQQQRRPAPLLRHVCPDLLVDHRGRLLLQGFRHLVLEDQSLPAEHRTPSVWEVVMKPRAAAAAATVCELDFELQEVAAIKTAELVGLPGSVEFEPPLLLPTAWFCLDRKVYITVQGARQLLVLDWNDNNYDSSRGAGGTAAFLSFSPEFYWMPNSPIMLAHRMACEEMLVYKAIPICPRTDGCLPLSAPPFAY